MAEFSPEIYRERRSAAARGPIVMPTERQARMLLYGLGISDEAGEVAGEIKKHVFHEKPWDETKVLNEIGDVLWYVDRLLALMGRSLVDALKANDDKLSARYPNGWAAAGKRYDHGDGL